MMHMLVDEQYSYGAVVEWAGDGSDPLTVGLTCSCVTGSTSMSWISGARMRDAVGGEDEAEAGAVHAPMPGKCFVIWWRRATAWSLVRAWLWSKP